MLKYIPQTWLIWTQLKHTRQEWTFNLQNCHKIQVILQVLTSFSHQNHTIAVLNTPYFSTIISICSSPMYQVAYQRPSQFFWHTRLSSFVQRPKFFIKKKRNPPTESAFPKLRPFSSQTIYKNFKVNINNSLQWLFTRHIFLGQITTRNDGLADII